MRSAIVGWNVHEVLNEYPHPRTGKPVVELGALLKTIFYIEDMSVEEVKQSFLKEHPTAGNIYLTKAELPERKPVLVVRGKG